MILPLPQLTITTGKYYSIQLIEARDIANILQYTEKPLALPFTCKKKAIVQNVNAAELRHLLVAYGTLKHKEEDQAKLCLSSV